MKSLTIVTTYGPRYWPLPIQKSIESTLENWPDHAKILVYPDDQTQCMSHSRLEHYDLCREQPVLDEFIVRNKNNQKRKPDMMWYLDADIITFEKIPMSWLEHIIPDHAFTSYLGRPKKGFSETGYYAFNTAHQYAGDFFTRWSEYYDKDLYFDIQKGYLNHFPRAGYTDSFTFDAVRLEFEQAGKMVNEDLNDGRFAGMRKARHPFINSELGQYMDHLKGFDRKVNMKSNAKDLTTKQAHKYWSDLK